MRKDDDVALVLMTIAAIGLFALMVENYPRRRYLMRGKLKVIKGGKANEQRGPFDK